MFEKSTHEIQEILRSIEEQTKASKQLREKKQREYEETRQRNVGIINNSETSPVERLRALVGNVLFADDILQITRERTGLFLTAMLATSMQIFQLEVATELLHAQSKQQTPQSPEGKRIEEMEKKLRQMKFVIDNEWKPIMDGLREELDNRRKFLDANR